MSQRGCCWGHGGHAGPIPRTGCDNAALCRRRTHNRAAVGRRSAPRQEAPPEGPHGTPARCQHGATGQQRGLKGGSPGCPENRQLLTHRWHWDQAAGVLLSPGGSSLSNGPALSSNMRSHQLQRDRTVSYSEMCLFLKESRKTPGKGVCRELGHNSPCPRAQDHQITPTITYSPPITPMNAAFLHAQSLFTALTPF